MIVIIYNRDEATFCKRALWYNLKIIPYAKKRKITIRYKYPMLHMIYYERRYTHIHHGK
jgi:hypothetical protein